MVSIMINFQLISRSGILWFSQLDGLKNTPSLITLSFEAQK